MNKTLSRIGTGAAGLVLLLVILGAVDMILKNLRVRADMTAEKLYTLSAGSKAILGQLKDDVTLKFYFSATSTEMPQGLKNYADQVQDYLKEYELAGKGHIVLEAYDPQPDSDAEEWAQRYGIEPQSPGMYGPEIYLGLVAVKGDAEEALPVLNPQEDAKLEYDITRMISRVANPKKPVVGLMTQLPVMGAPQMPFGPQAPQGSQPVNQ